MTRRRLPFGVLVLVALAAGCGHETREPARQPTLIQQAGAKPPPVSGLTGSKRCRDCHEDFYKLWSASWHGLAMQPYTAEFAKARLSPPKGDVAIGKRKYRAQIGGAEGWVRQSGPEGEHDYPIAHVMGGKNVYYFLTPMARGRLQVLPVAYDVHKKAWYDMAASGVRHFPDRRDEALDWTDRMFAFNTTCFNCHVTELSTNYDLATDTYHTTWAEPGISCESCHGSAKEHVEAMEAEPPGHAPKEIKIIRAKQLASAQTNDLCATCHAKLIPLSLSFRPGDKFFDHFDLVTLEHADFYPDGRDLGENYTETSWLMNPCLTSGKLDCNHCHTPSGRPRFEGRQSSQSCLPCHEKLVGDAAAHGHHKAGSPGNECIACHMPMTRFAAMGRTDHSMRPPAPAATLAFKSPNACNLCHADRDASWADGWVRQWYPRDYQAEVLRRAALVDQARKRDWKHLGEMLAALRKQDGDEVYKTSLVRLLAGCEDSGKWPALLGLLEDASPLVRSSAVSALGGHLTPEVLKALLAATADPSRLVRIRSAMALAAVDPASLSGQRERTNLQQAIDDFMAAMHARPDDWSSHANLGNFYFESHDFTAAAACFETATRLEPRQIGPLVNAAMAYSNLDQNDKAEASLRRALALAPQDAAANFNLGLLLGESQRWDEAEQRLRSALASNPQMAAAAYNLGVILARRSPDEAIAWCRNAHQLRPEEAKYAHTLAFYLRQKGNFDEAVVLLRQVIREEPLYWDAYGLLGEIYEDQRDYPKAAAVYNDALKMEPLPPPLRRQLETKVRAIESRRRPGEGR